MRRSAVNRLGAVTHAARRCLRKSPRRAKLQSNTRFGRLAMPWLPLYIDEIDAAGLGDELNFDPEIAFIVATSPGVWVARRALHGIADGRLCLWHVPSGPLPLFRGVDRQPGTVADPWAGWTEFKAGADPLVPYFGAGHPGIVWWNVRTRSRRVPGGIGLSSFEWIGNHYRVLGNAADPRTEAWWAQLRKSVRRWKARRVPRSGPTDGPNPEIWALPSALSKINAGVPRDENPFVRGCRTSR
jgi:hypothetical protein